MVQVTKQQAAARLIAGAMRAYDEGDEVCATTLAGAAEEAMPPHDETLFVMLRTLGGMWIGSDRTAADALNCQRNWLKHYNKGEPDPFEIDFSLIMIHRALSRYTALYGREAETPEIAAFFAEARRFDPED